MNAFAIRHVGEPHADAESLRGCWTSPPPWDLESDAVVAVEDGRITGYGDIGDQAADGTLLWLDVRGEPAAALARGDGAARAANGSRPGAVIRPSRTPESRLPGVPRASGGSATSASSYRMYATLDVDLVTPPTGPRGSPFGTRAEHEAPMVHAVYQETFAEHEWFVAGAAGRLRPSHDRRGRGRCRFVAEDGDEVAGIAICRPHAEGDPADGLGLDSRRSAPWRRRGLGSALLLHAFHDL